MIQEKNILLLSVVHSKDLEDVLLIVTDLKPSRDTEFDDFLARRIKKAYIVNRTWKSPIVRYVIIM